MHMIVEQECWHGIPLLFWLLEAKISLSVCKTSAPHLCQSPNLEEGINLRYLHNSPSKLNNRFHSLIITHFFHYYSRSVA